MTNHSTSIKVAEKQIPQVSIGMPVYNGEKYIRNALDSLLTQTFTDFELIISDNASTDNTQAISEEYVRRDPRVRYVRQQENKGAAVNFKFVLNSAQTDFFMWAAYDDLWAPDYLTDTMSLLINKNIDFVFPSFELRSIRLGVAKRFSPKCFKFIESPDRRFRILHFMATHYLSHSTNIVYSLFRTEFLRLAYATQDISNDGALGLVVLSRGRGTLSNAIFSKRYSIIWPGMLFNFFSIFKGWIHKRDIDDEARRAIKAAKLSALKLFPDLEREITFIFDHYHPKVYDRCYRVCAINKLL
jgi:glycosyltransferase involved in cell wall biosynthesis